MRIAYYMPFKPMNHPNPSGDLIIGKEIFFALKQAGHFPEIASNLRLRWVYYKPLLLVKLLFERKRLVRSLKSSPPELWLSYHCYYKAPDLLGAYCARKLSIPYVIFQGIYSTKRRKNLRTYPGFVLNTKVLESAAHIFTNKKRDYHNLCRIISEDKLTFIPPGIEPEHFTFSQDQRTKQREVWRTENQTVIMTTAMMRPGVKTDGLLFVIKICRELMDRGHRIQLMIAGDGKCYKIVNESAKKLLQHNCTLLGKVNRREMYHYYSGADIFVFPGVEESLGMVYLEAQSCGLPAVAFEDWGAKEAIVHEHTGLLSPAAQPELFTKNILKLIENSDLRKRMGENGKQHIRQNHDLNKNYRLLAEKLQAIIDTKDAKKN